MAQQTGWIQDESTPLVRKLFSADAARIGLWRWSAHGVLPVVIDAASCTPGLKEDVLTQLEGPLKEQYASLEIIDSIAWCRELLPRLTFSRRLARVAVHPTCSTTHLGLAHPLQQIATHPADEVEVPVGTTCCGRQATGRPYESFVFLLEELSRPEGG